MSNPFSVLSRIDCSSHTEKKGQLTYLSWTWAWSTLMKSYPESAYYFHEDVIHSDGTVTVSCTVSVAGTDRRMWLPVMDNRNNAIPIPDARKISDARMRCLVKCIAMHGLGLYIYAGEDLPEPDHAADNDALVAYCAETLPSLQKAAAQGTKALQHCFAKLPAVPHKQAFWKQHGVALKEAAAKVSP